jgi:hypothetical protein
LPDEVALKTTYDVITEPPFEAGASRESKMLLEDVAAVRLVGTPGAVGVAKAIERRVPPPKDQGDRGTNSSWWESRTAIRACPAPGLGYP